MGTLIRVLIFAAVGYALYRWIAGATNAGGSRSKFICGSCQHCKTAFDDGVICMFSGRETFKNEVHIANCGAFKRRKGSA